MDGINVTSEIKPLRKVLLHRPGKELLNLTPESLTRLLFDDIPFLKVAQQEHDAFANILRENGVEVVYLEDLMAETIADPEIKEKFIKQWIDEGGVRTKKWKSIIFDFLMSYKDNKELVLKTMEGINLHDVDVVSTNSLVDLVNAGNKLIIDPMPNLYFTRDPFACIGKRVSINKMYSVTRSRETIYAEYIFAYHPSYQGVVKKFYSRNSDFNIEGGDIFNFSSSLIGVGISQRTCSDAIELLARRIFASRGKIKTILAFNIPSSRAFMHLDTVFTQIDVDKFLVHPGIVNSVQVYEITKGKETEFNVKRISGKFDEILARYLKLDKVTLIECAGGDSIASQREQWNDGANTLCLRPGTVIVYERNDVTNRILKEKGIHVLEMPSAELSRGRGGPRCMTMPLIREE